MRWVLTPMSLVVGVGFFDCALEILDWGLWQHGSELSRQRQSDYNTPSDRGGFRNAKTRN